MALDVLRRAVEEAREMGEGLEDPDEKESHQGKTLSTHVSECSEISKRICDIFGIEEKFRRFSEVICALHDLGKLHPEWGFGKRSIKHSFVGFEVLNKLKERGKLTEITGLNEGEQDLLLFMIKKHHSALRVSRKGGFKEYEALSWLKKHPEDALGYADSFGAFKLADFASAMGMMDRVSRLLEADWPGPERALSMLDQLNGDKFRKQLEISRCKGHVSLAAPTGWGKTLVGVMSGIPDGARYTKLFYSLPTITAIRKMRERMGRYFDPEDVGEYFYFVDVDLFREVREDEEESRLLDFYRLFIPKVNITTVDQILLTLMRAGKYHMRRFELRGSVIVFDEYHLLPARMIGALAELLSWYAPRYGMKVLLMTATPLKVYEDILKSSLGDVRAYDLSGEYSKLRRHRMELIDVNRGLELAEELVKEGKRVLVVMNTVGRAMEFYKGLEAPEKLLLHSRFTVNDRYEKEGNIENCRVLVATQVAEVSLDVSFDALITDLAPIPAMIQRMGRTNRYGSSDVREPNVYVMKLDQDHEPYSYEEMAYSLLLLEEMADRIGEEGEGIYLEMLREYDELVRDSLLQKANELRNAVRSSVLEENQVLALDVDEERIARELREEASVLVVPSEFEDEVRDLFSKMRDASYEERNRIWAEIKGYMVPVRLWMAMKYGRDVPGIPLRVIRGRYDRELGLLIDRSS
ncbi:MAG: CRISPR-associated helicase Cas3' [Candidatus Korarchaeum sp.]